MKKKADKAIVLFVWIALIIFVLIVSCGCERKQEDNLPVAPPATPVIMEPGYCCE